MVKYKIFNLLPSFGTNTYVIYDKDCSCGVLVDPADSSDKVINFLKKENIEISHILLTHGHGDHIGGVDFFKEKTKASVAIHKHDAEKLVNPEKNLSSFMGNEIKFEPADRILNDGDIISIGTSNIMVIHTPGHTSGSVCFLVDNLLFSGDTIFENSIGRTDFPDGSMEQILVSIKEKLWQLDDDTKVFPGHGEETTIGDEKIQNPFVGVLSQI